jgi:hypothetical protein
LKFIKEHSVFLFILISASVLRFLPLFNYQFTFDELSGLDRTQFSSFSELMEKGVKIDAHPAFVQVLIYYLTQIFGYVTWIIKLPFLLVSLGAIVYAYAFGLRNFSKQAGLLAAAVLSFSLIFVFYAPIARMYISGVFFSLALLFYFFEIFFLQNLKTKNFILLAVFALLSALNQHINALFAFTVCVSGLFFLSKNNAKKYLITCAIIILAYLPHLPITLYQLSVPGIGRENGGWLEAADFSVIFDFIKILFGTGKAYVFLVFGLLFSWWITMKLFLSKKQLFLFSLFIVNYLIIYLYSLLRSPIYQHSVMLFSATALVMGACGMMEFKDKKLFYLVLTGMCSVLLYKSYVKKDYLHQAVKTVYEYQFERTVHYKKVHGDEKVYPIFCDADTLMRKIYFKKYQTTFECKFSSDSVISNMENRIYEINSEGRIKKVSTLHLFSEFVKNVKADYITISSSMPAQQAIVKETFPYLIENTQTQGINFKVYSKRKEDSAKQVADDQVLSVSNVMNKGAFVYSQSKLIKASGNLFVLAIDSLNEFPFEAKAYLNSIFSKEGEVILVRASIKTKSDKGLLETCISVNDKKDNTSYGYAAKGASDFVQKADSTLSIYSEYFNGTKFRSIKDKSLIGAYIWNRGKENVELRSFEIKVIDYWPMKWHFWE